MCGTYVDRRIEKEVLRVWPSHLRGCTPHPGVVMAIEAIHSFLVTPSKNVDEPPELGGTVLPLKGKLYDMLSGIYVKSGTECRIEIAFNPDSSGSQQNDARDTLLKYVASPSVNTARAIAKRLQSVTTHRSGSDFSSSSSGRKIQSTR